MIWLSSWSVQDAEYQHLFISSNISCVPGNSKYCQPQRRKYDNSISVFTDRSNHIPTLHQQSIFLWNIISNAFNAYAMPLRYTSSESRSMLLFPVKESKTNKEISVLPLAAQHTLNLRLRLWVGADTFLRCRFSALYCPPSADTQAPSAFSQLSPSVTSLVFCLSWLLSHPSPLNTHTFTSSNDEDCGSRH